jgi:uncharacterized protein (DUF58 family)
MCGEFHYRLRRSAGGHRPGAHPASTLGAGHRFAGHARLFDIPDPRRIDLRASLRDVRREWLVRTHQQRAAVPVYALVDASASMNFGTPAPKLARAADFAESMGNSAFRAGDPAGLIVFDAADPQGTGVPARHGRGIGSLLGARLRALTDAVAGTRTGLQAAVESLAGRDALVFLVSDFYWPLQLLEPALDLLNRATVVPVVVWDRAEREPPAASGLLRVTDAETRAGRTVWVGRKLRARWLAQMTQHRRDLEARFMAREIRPFYLVDAFDPVAMSRFFLDETA